MTIKDCYSCKYFKGYDTINENVECSFNGVVHFECNQIRICDDYWEE